MAESEEELKSLLMSVKEESEKVNVKTQHSSNEDHGIHSHHFMANRWGKSGKCQISLSWPPNSLKTVTAVTKFKKCLLFGRKAVENLDVVLKSRDITLLTKSL